MPTASEVRRTVAERMGYMPGQVQFWAELHDWQKSAVGNQFFNGADVGDKYAYATTIQGEILCRHLLTQIEIDTFK